MMRMLVHKTASKPCKFLLGRYSTNLEDPHPCAASMTQLPQRVPVATCSARGSGSQWLYMLLDMLETRWARSMVLPYPLSIA